MTDTSNTDNSNVLFVLGILLLLFIAPVTVGYSYLHIQNSTTEPTDYIYAEKVPENVTPQNYIEFTSLSKNAQELFKESLIREGTIGGYQIKESTKKSTINELKQVQHPIKYQDNYYSITIEKSRFNQGISILMETILITLITMLLTILLIHKYLLTSDQTKQKETSQA